MEITLIGKEEEENDSEN